MHFTCQNPKCQETLTFNKQKIPLEGANFRCPKCQHIFTVKPEIAPNLALNNNKNDDNIIKRKCPNCNQLLMLGGGKIPLEGANFRCPKCQNVFAVKPETRPDLALNNNKNDDNIIKKNCPNCNQLLMLGGGKIPLEGANFRCPKCQNVFAVKPETRPDLALNNNKNDDNIIKKNCPNCNQLLILGGGKIPLEGANFRCPKCQNVFAVKPEIRPDLALNSK